MDEGPKRIPCPSAPTVLPSSVRPYVPAIVRKAQDVVPLGLVGRERDQRFELRIAAHDAIQGDEICRPELRSKAYKVAGAKLHPILMATALRFFLGGGDIGSGRFDMDGPPDAAAHQLMVKHTDAGPDIEKSLWRDPEVAEALQDQPGSTGGRALGADTGPTPPVPEPV